MRSLLLMGALGLTVLLAGCGGSGYDGPASSDSQVSETLTVVGAPSVMLAPGEFRKLTISGGRPPYTTVSQDTSTVLAMVSNGTLSLAGVRADSAPVNVVVADAARRSVAVAVTVSNVSTQGVLALSPDHVAMLPGGVASVALLAGTPPFTVQSLSPSHVAASVVGNVMTVTGLLEVVDAQVRVMDSMALVRVLPVTVATASTTGLGADFSTNVPQLLSLPSGVTRAYTLVGGTGPYVASTVNPAVLQPTVRGSLLSLTSGVSGSVALQVTDAAGTQLWRSVTVENGLSPLALSVSELGGATGDIVTAYVTGGRPPYGMALDASGVVTGSVTGSSLFLSLLAPGAAKVTMYDSDNTTVTLSVFATGLALPTKFALSPTKVVISEALAVGSTGSVQQTTVVLTLGKAEAPVQAFSSNPNLLTPTVVGSTVEVRTPGTALSPLPPCVDDDTTVTITVIDAAGQSAATDIVIRDAGACTG